jgi:peptide/nickel transport system substrate-binding protein
VIAGTTCFLLAACGGGSPSGSASGKPVAGDVLTLTAPAAPPTLDPAKVDNSFINFTLLAYDPLIELAPDGSLQPALAARWGFVGSGNTVFDLTLRSKATFSDGSPVTAAAVKTSLEYAKRATGPQSSLLGAVSSITVTGPLSLRFQLSQPDPLLPNTLTQTYGFGQILSPAGVAHAAKLGVASPSYGAGPYTFDPAKSVAGDHYTYVARSGYYDPARVHYKKIVIRVIASPQSVLNALTTGQVDAAVGDYTTVKQAKAARLQIKSEPFVWQGLNLIDRGGVKSKPLGDVRVRQAINYAIDRKAIASALLGPYGSPTDEFVVPGADGYSAKAADYYAYNPAKAKALLAAAGYPHGFTLPVLTAQFVGLDITTQAIAAQLAKVGITVKITSTANVATYETGMVSQQYPVVAVAYGAQPMYLAGAGLFLPQAPAFNGFHTADAYLEGLYAKAAAAAPAERAQLDRQMQEYLVEHAWFAPVVFAPVFIFARSTLGGVAVSPGAPVANPLDWFDTK